MLVSVDEIHPMEDEMGHTVTVFSHYPFQLGQKIRIEGPNRRGDWQVVGLGEGEVTLRCPISGKEFVWKNFCYFTHEEADAVWPQP